MTFQLVIIDACLSLLFKKRPLDVPSDFYDIKVFKINQKSVLLFVSLGATP